MREHVDRPLTLEEMCKSAHLSPFYFDRVFRRATGLSAGAFQAALRMEAAKRKLLETEHSITEICFDLGYKSLGSFTTRFSATVGMSPIAFRAWGTHLAEMPIDVALAQAFDAPQPCGPLLGEVHGAPTADAFVWIGAFTKGIPQRRPAAGTLRRGDGQFSAPAPPDGRYDILCAAIAPTKDWRRYMFLGDHVRVATTGTVTIRGGVCSCAIELHLRPLRSTDPPILAPLPLLAL
jgi:AraC family transcriptional regulator